MYLARIIVSSPYPILGILAANLRYFYHSRKNFREKWKYILATVGTHSPFTVDERTFIDDGCTFIGDERPSTADEYRTPRRTDRNAGGRRAKVARNLQVISK